MKKTISFILIISISILLLAQNNPLNQDINNWTKLVIEEVFISRSTNLEYGDFASAPEFGWKIYKDNFFLRRSSNIYATIYYPVNVKDIVRLQLIERDFLRDDVVSSVYIKAGKNKYILNMNSDFVIISRQPFYPDKNSGKDSKPSGAKLLKNNIRGSVSFLNGDYTDYFKFQKNQTIMIIATSSLDISEKSSEINLNIYPKEKIIQDVYIVDSNDSSTLRIRGKIAQGNIRYFILSVTGENRAEKLLNKAVSHIKKGNPTSTIFFEKSFVKAFSQYNNAALEKFCSKVEKNPEHYSKNIVKISEISKRGY